MGALWVLIAGLAVLWAVLWIMLLRHEARRAARGQPRHGAPRMALAALALLIILFFGGSLLLLVTAHGDLLSMTDWSRIGPAVAAPVGVALIAAYFTLRRGG